MEKWNAYTRDGKLTDEILVRDEPIPDGLYHLVCEVLVRHVDGSYLCMKRAQTKPVYPGYYEATAGGSALSGEDKLTCVKRELREETDAYIVKLSKRKNVFIEGIQGMGKSTLINSIFSAVPEFRICREGDYSPIDLAWCTWMSIEEYETVLEKYESIRDEIVRNTVEENEHFIVSYTKIITDIPGFHKDLEQYEIYNGRRTFEEFKEIIFNRFKNFTGIGYLFECSFFQNIMEDLILFHELTDDEIVELYRELYDMMDKENFRLLYLYSDKLKESLEVIKKERSDNQGNEMWYPLMLEYLINSPYGKKRGYSGFEDMIKHFKHRQKLEMRIIREVVGESAIILKAKEWSMDEIITCIQ